MVYLLNLASGKFEPRYSESSYSILLNDTEPTIITKPNTSVNVTITSTIVGSPLAAFSINGVNITNTSKYYGSDHTCNLELLHTNGSFQVHKTESTFNGVYNIRFT